MSKVIVAASPIQGHVAPILAVAADLVRRGHEVVVYTGSRFEQPALRTGARFRALPADADFDDRKMDTYFPARAALPAGPAQLIFDIQHIFVGTVPAQFRGLRDLLAEFPADVVVSEQTFFAPLALALGALPGKRPALVTLGVMVPTFSSADTAPVGIGALPLEGAAGQARNQAMYAEASKLLAGVRKVSESVFESLGVTLSEPIFDSLLHATDHYLQLTVPGFEYPRGDAPKQFQLIGPLPLDSGDSYAEPEWWSELSHERPVVVVTQGTMANGDLTELLIPTLRALADLDALVVAATARDDGPYAVQGLLREVPANARLAGFVPFDRLLPYADVLVTNGGYGGVHAALHHGVPLVVAGATEDKPEVAARVEWSGTGINLRTGTPSDGEIRTAVENVLQDSSYRLRAEALSKEFVQYSPFEAIAEIIERA